MQRPGQPGSYRGLTDAARTIYREEGLASFYKGLVPALFGVSHGAVQFMAYEELKSLLKSSGKTDLVGISFVSSSFFFCFSSKKQSRSFFLSLLQSVPEYLGVAALSKVVASLTTYPYQVLRSRLQVWETLPFSLFSQATQLKLFLHFCSSKEAL